MGAETTWGPGLYCVGAAMLLRFLDLVVFALFPVRAARVAAGGAVRDRAAAAALALPLVASSYVSLPGGVGD